jgi:S1/P1 nuclease
MWPRRISSTLAIRRTPSGDFVDLPLGASGYPATDPAGSDPMRVFVSQDDIVHALQRCISILESTTAPPDFSKRQAVRWVVHLVGDLRQPMHVTSGYYTPALASFKPKPARITDPVNAGATGIRNDRGTNGLLFSSSSDNNLHATWDRCLPGQVSGASCSSGPGAGCCGPRHVYFRPLVRSSIDTGPLVARARRVFHRTRASSSRPLTHALRWPCARGKRG